jgi:CRISPR type III-B/RAMP module-associated protein Cmr5
MPQNLEQRRAAHADKKASDCAKLDKEGDCLSGYPSLIINNGLLATLAFSMEKKKQHLRVADAIAWHLHEMGITTSSKGETPNAQTLKKGLTEADSQILRRATDEALSFLAYLKRFVRNA